MDWANKGIKAIVRNVLKVLNDTMFEKLKKNMFIMVQWKGKLKEQIEIEKWKSWTWKVQFRVEMKNLLNGFSDRFKMAEKIVNA